MSQSHTLRVPVTVKLTSEQRMEALQALNEMHTGQPQIPFGAPVSEEHRDATYALCRGFRAELRVAFGPDGRMRVLGVEDEA